MSAVRTLAFAIGASLAMCAWSELVFFNEGVALSVLGSFDRGVIPVATTFVEFGLFYMIPSLALTALASRFGTGSLAHIMLIGALIGFAIEGAVVPAVHENPPVSWAWTSIAWHAPMTVGVGVFLVPYLLRSGACGLVGLCLLGVFWGLWTPWVTVEPGGVSLDLGRFVATATLTTAMMLVGYVALSFGQVPTHRLSWLLGVPAAVLLILLASPFLPFSVGPIALTVTFLLLLQWLGPEPAPPPKLPLNTLPKLLLLPVTAIATFAFGEAGYRIDPAELPGLAFIAGLGVWLGLALWGLKARRRGSP